jgi:hypothetical protein
MEMCGGLVYTVGEDNKRAPLTPPYWLTTLSVQSALVNLFTAIEPFLAFLEDMV